MIVGVVLLAGALSAPLDVGAANAKIVKLYGAGGLGRLEGFGTGCLISADGHILTVYSPLLDTENLHAVLSDGRRLDAKLSGLDIAREIAVVKVEAQGLDHFDLSMAPKASTGQTVFVLSNLYNIAAGAEPVSLQRGVIAAVASLAARKGLLEVSYPHEVYILDAITNNPGAAGGAVVNTRGELVGLVGKELRNTATNTWVNFAIPIEHISAWARGIQSGESEAPAPVHVKKDLERAEMKRADLRGIGLLPDVLDRTPAFVDAVETGSPAEQAGLRPDDLIVFVNEKIVQSARELRVSMLETAADGNAQLVVLRGDDLIKIELPPRKRESSPDASTQP